MARIIPFFVRPSAAGPRNAVERAFLPAALEIVETPASPTARLSALLILLFLASALVWSYFGHVDIVASAPGKIMALTSTKVVQPYETGVVRAILVADGDKVKQGDVLVELDRTVSTADRSRYADMLLQAQLDQARLNELMVPTGGDPFARVAAAADLLAAARARLDAEQREEAAKVARLDTQTAQKRSEEAAVEAGIAKIDAALPLVRARATIREHAMTAEYGNKLDYLQQQQQLVEMEHERIVQLRKHDEAEASLVELGIERAQTEAQFRRTVLTDLAKANREVAEASTELAKADRKQTLESLTAPVDGDVQDLTVHTLGGVVTPAQQILRIVPSSGGIEAEVVVANRDVGFVQTGQEAEIKIDTFPFTRYGLIPGHVRELARDAVEEPRADQRRQGSQSTGDDPASIERSGQLVYTARITLDRNSLTIDGHTVELAPGMSITAEIKTGKRRVLDYLLSSFQRYSHDALRER
ncbi:MAG TPA: HlyD family type I secretion periplasmic adaptor subunit [Aliidongia sp.]|uniref:HlyD family type I secretion periplasmic adaptor subunit n=1 Tax=Aliidongia sp. TaxID=1914230 RepID=UPI002DDD3523|nr:HlyD family type I secretion periplasmic adaptor subunit [Aliidongia sp.]HEV2677091.1 HlyD family type I secretion periplasmic adaptor subunit [Aliidongia sp.]